MLHSKYWQAYSIRVNQETVKCCDAIFATEGARYIDKRLSTPLRECITACSVAAMHTIACLYTGNRPSVATLSYSHVMWLLLAVKTAVVTPRLLSSHQITGETQVCCTTPESQAQALKLYDSGSHHGPSHLQRLGCSQLHAFEYSRQKMKSSSKELQIVLLVIIITLAGLGSH